MVILRRVIVVIVLLLLSLECNADKRIGGIPLPKYRTQHAIVIGINYTNLSDASQLEVPQLSTAENDAQAVYDTLIEHYGYLPENVHLLLGKDATLQAIRSRFGTEYLGDRRIVTADDSVLIFYAGHGVRQERQGRSEDFVGMLYPADLHVIEGKGVDPVSCLRIDDLLRMVQDYCAAKHKLLVLDSCHSGEVFNFKSSRSAGVNRGFRENLFRAPVLQAIAAAQATQVAADADGAGDHSPFTSVFLTALQHGPSGDSQTLFTASELFAFIPNRIRTMENVRQDPRGGWLEGEGDFYFFPKNLKPFLEVASDGGNANVASRNSLATIPEVVGPAPNSLFLLITLIAMLSTVAIIWWYRQTLHRQKLALNVAGGGTTAAAGSASLVRQQSGSTTGDELYLQVVGSPYAYRAPPGAESVSIGRQRRKAGQSVNEGNDFVIRVPDSEEKSRLLSRRHLQITRVDNIYFVTDSSSKGTHLNDQPLVKGTPTLIDSGDKLTVAGVLTLEVLIRRNVDKNSLEKSAMKASSEVELSPWNNTGVVVEATLGDLVTLEDE